MHCTLSTLMGKARFNIQDVHERTGLSRTTIAQLYHDKATRVDFETIEKLCSLFNCSVTDLLQLERVQESEVSLETHTTQSKAKTFRALSLFASAGVAETYFEKHGIKVCVASELLPERVKFYKHLYPGVQVFQGDITNETLFEQIINTALNERCDFLLATPPCQGMSTAGLQLKDDPRNRLILYVVETIKRIKPKFCMIENVPELLNTKIEINNNWIYINDFIEAEIGNDYVINKNKVVNAMNYGVAQSRERCVYLLARKDQGILWEFPKPSAKITTMRDAIGDLPSLDPEVTDISIEEMHKLFPLFEDKKAQGLKISKWHYPPRHKLRHVIAMMHTPEGQSAWDNEKYYPTLADGSKSKGYKNTYKRQWWDKPAYTVTKYTSRLGSQENGHPGTAQNNYLDEERRIFSDARVLSIFELMRVSSLPDDWNIPDWASSNLIREILGEGVPPRLMESALIELEKAVNGK